MGNQTNRDMAEGGYLNGKQDPGGIDPEDKEVELLGRRSKIR